MVKDIVTRLSKRVLGFLGFKYCKHCGKSLFRAYSFKLGKGEIYKCPRCERFKKYETD
jgi:uncharacterized Zn finger protein (UPF0148 family)